MDHTTRELVARALHWTGALLRLLRTSREWYDAVHYRTAAPSGRGGVPVVREGDMESEMVRWRAGYLPTRHVINTDGWCRMRVDGAAAKKGWEVMCRILRAYGRAYQWPGLGTNDLAVLRAVVPYTLGIPHVRVGDTQPDPDLLEACGVRTIDSPRLQEALRLRRLARAAAGADPEAADAALAAALAIEAKRYIWDDEDDDGSAWHEWPDSDSDSQ